ncbi:helix-turn-helix domain-containing protein [Streptomyces sp. NPDC047000]|uniref:helix-turn-helix domain-containing protein n=1 Tax=Streptomyces sp. NPDC047000 TaxID=3155474 RepID=UPI00340A4836
MGRLVRQYRAHVGLTQQQLADLSTVSVRAIREIEHGKVRRPRTVTLGLIADGLRLGPRARAGLLAAGTVHPRWTLWTGDGIWSATPPQPGRRILGRDREAAIIEEELSSGRERVTNVVGLCGVGKTRLALEVARRLHTGAGLPVLWITADDDGTQHSGGPLDALLRASAADLIAPAAVPAKAAADRGDGLRKLAELVGGRPVLLVVDGVDDHQPRRDLLSRLLDECPGLRLLMTSRHTDAVTDEWTFLLAPLPLPDTSGMPAADDIERSPAARLFLDQVRRVRPGFVPAESDAAIIGDLCRRLDGLPRALQAAASWLAVYPLDDLSRRIDHPASLLAHLCGVGGAHTLESQLRRHLERMPPEDRILLTTLCEQGGRFGLEDVARATGASRRDCGLVVYGLLAEGVVRPSPEPGRGRFEVLNIVRAFHAPAELTDASR